MARAFTLLLSIAFRLRSLRLLGFRLSDRDLARGTIDAALEREAAGRLSRRLEAEAAARAAGRNRPVSQETISQET